MKCTGSPLDDQMMSYGRYASTSKKLMRARERKREREKERGGGGEAGEGGERKRYRERKGREEAGDK